MIIKEIFDEIQKQEISSCILNDLPEWFGIEESTKWYVDNVKMYPMFAVYENNKPIAFYSLRKENNDVLDMFVLGVLKKHHNKGVGTLLQNHVNKYALDNKYKYLMVLTLAKKVNNFEYLLTRKFYLKMGFIDFYQNDDIFNVSNPCQIMIKSLIELNN